MENLEVKSMSNDLKPQEKVTVATDAEQTKSGPVFVPHVDIFESEDAMTLMADMPGVEKDGLSINLEENVLTIKGDVKTQETPARVLYREYETGDYYRQFSLSEVIDQEKISATLRDGVLTLVLPKVEPAKPRRIEVQVT
jgi:HSP20 family protein